MRLSASWTGTPSAGFVGVRRRRFAPCVLLFLGAVAGVAEATQLTVRVHEPNGNPISLATVCMAQGSQAGSRLTTGGVAVLTGLPAGTYTLNVIKSNFQTKSQSVNLSGTQELTVTLQPGASTPPAGVNCQGGGAVTTLPPIKITSFEVEGLPADFKMTSPPVTHLRLRATFDRRPAFFRIIEDSEYAYTTPLQNLRTRPWEPLPLNAPVAPFIYIHPIDFTKPYGTRVVHLQVSSVASEDAASQIKSVSVILTPKLLQTSVLTGAALQGFLDRAQQEGYGPLKRGAYQDDPDLSTACPQVSDVRNIAVLVDSQIIPGLGGVGAIQAPIKTFIEKAAFHAFAGPPLMPFWKITDLVVGRGFVQLSESGSGFSASTTVSVGGYTMVNNPFQPPLQTPERSINIERTTRFSSDKYVACMPQGAGPPPLPFPRLGFPSFLSVTVVGPDGRDPREAFPPRGPTAGGPLKLRPGIPPRTIRP